MDVDIDDMTVFRFDVLWCLAGGEDSGLGLVDRLEEYYGDGVHHGRLYPNLDWLAERDLVEKYDVDERTNGYEITEQGVQLLEQRYTWIKGCVDDEFTVVHQDSGDVALKPRAD